MDQRALNRLMQEGQTSSGCVFDVESPRIPELYAQLKQTPAISSVSIPEVALASFDETIAKTIQCLNGSPDRLCRNHRFWDGLQRRTHCAL
jgi:putative ABC transport system permease protein